ncbi:MAG: rhodanese-like domain-containing protein [Bacteroidia bacterium]
MNKIQLIKRTLLTLVIIATVITGFNCSASSSEGEPWKPEQLMDPATLAARIESGKDVPILFNIGPSGIIKNAIDIGPGQDAENVEKLKSQLSKLAKDQEVVVYCGCCPFKNCPNIRPVFKALNEAGMTNAHLLNLSENLRVDWIAKGYPMASN